MMVVDAGGTVADTPETLRLAFSSDKAGRDVSGVHPTSALFRRPAMCRSSQVNGQDTGVETVHPDRKGYGPQGRLRAPTGGTPVTERPMAARPGEGVPAVLVPARRRAALAGLAALLVLAGCSRPANQAAPPLPSAFVIGLLTAGPGAGAGRDAVRGAQLAVEIVNGDHPDLALPLAPGLGLAGGVPLSVSIADTKGDAAAAQGEATRLYREVHAVGLVAADSTTVAAAVCQPTERYPLPLVDAGTSADRLTETGPEV